MSKSIQGKEEAYVQVVTKFKTATWVNEIDICTM